MNLQSSSEGKIVAGKKAETPWHLTSNFLLFPKFKLLRDVRIDRKKRYGVKITILIPKQEGVHYL